MARTRFDPNPYIPAGQTDAGQPNPDYGVAAPVTIDLASATTGDPREYDVFVGNQGEGAINATLNWTAADFSEVFMPPHAHRPRVDLVPGAVVHIDSLVNVQIVAVRPTGTAVPLSSTFSVSARKTHITAASVGNDYLVIGAGLRATN